jgi:hypothetical protein
MLPDHTHAVGTVTSTWQPTGAKTTAQPTAALPCKSGVTKTFGRINTFDGAAKGNWGANRYNWPKCKAVAETAAKGCFSTDQSGTVTAVCSVGSLGWSEALPDLGPVLVPPGFCCLPVSCSGAPKFSLWGPKKGATCGARGMF